VTDIIVGEKKEKKGKEQHLWAKGGGEKALLFLA